MTDNWIAQAESAARVGSAVSRDVLRHFLRLALKEMLLAQTQRGGFQRALERQSLLIERLSDLERVACNQEDVDTLTPDILSRWLHERRAFAKPATVAAIEALRALVTACEPIAWTKRPGEPHNLKPYWSFVATDVVERARAVLTEEPRPTGTHP